MLLHSTGGTHRRWALTRRISGRRSTSTRRGRRWRTYGLLSIRVCHFTRSIIIMFFYYDNFLRVTTIKSIGYLFSRSPDTEADDTNNDEEDNSAYDTTNGSSTTADINVGITISSISVSVRVSSVISSIRSSV